MGGHSGLPCGGINSKVIPHNNLLLYRTSSPWCAVFFALTFTLTCADIRQKFVKNSLRLLNVLRMVIVKSVVFTAHLLTLLLLFICRLMWGNLFYFKLSAWLTRLCKSVKRNRQKFTQKFFQCWFWLLRASCRCSGYRYG